MDKTLRFTPVLMIWWWLGAISEPPSYRWCCSRRCWRGPMR